MPVGCDGAFDVWYVVYNADFFAQSLSFALNKRICVKITQAAAHSHPVACIRMWPGFTAPDDQTSARPHVRAQQRVSECARDAGKNAELREIPLPVQQR